MEGVELVWSNEIEEMENCNKRVCDDRKLDDKEENDARMPNNCRTYLPK